MGIRRQPWPWEPQSETPVIEVDPLAPVRATIARVYHGELTDGLRVTASESLSRDWQRGRDAIVDDCREVYGCGQSEAHNRATEIVAGQAAKGQ